MGLEFWKDRVNDVDKVSADDINTLGHGIVENTQDIKAQGETLKNKVDVAPPPLKEFNFSTLNDEAIRGKEGNPIAGAGASGTAIQFDGESSLRIAPVLLNQDIYTIEFKIHTTQEGMGGNWTTGIGVLDADKSGWHSDFGFVLVDGGYLVYGEGDEEHEGESKTVTTKSPINDGLWHKITLTRNNGTASIYVDDVLHNQAPCFYTQRIWPDDFYAIGSKRKPESSYQYFDGMIDDLKFYTTVEVPYSGLSMVGKTGKYQDLSNWSELKGYIDSNSGGGSAKYDYIINSQADFDAMIASSNWLGATSILFNTPNVTKNIMAEADGIVIPPTVKRIDGNGHSLTINNSYNSSNFAIIKFATKPTEFEISGLNINCWLYNTLIYSVFSNLINVYNCNIITYADGHQSYMPLQYAVDHCDNLINVKTTVYGSTYWSSHTYACVYNSCNNLINCYGYIDGCDNGTVYGSCTKLLNCDGFSSDKGYGGLSTSGYGTSSSVYSSCQNIANCTGTLEAYDLSAGGSVYSSTKGLSNCTASTAIKASDTTNVKLKGFSSCSYTNNCRKGSSFTGTLWSGTTNNRDDDSCDLA